jgi:hypothetical protein
MGDNCDPLDTWNTADGSPRPDNGNLPGEGGTIRRARRGVSGTAFIAAGLLAVALACDGGPPSFSVERTRESREDAGQQRWLSIGSPATPPPGRYRFLRLQADGGAQVREVHTVNGPGPWTTYIGPARVPSVVAAEALRAVAGRAPEPHHGSNADACVLAFGMGAVTEWHGCAFHDVARRVLADLPSLAPPAVSPACDAAICQVRLFEGSAPIGHAESGVTRRDVILDSAGALWCAAASSGPGGMEGVLHVERAHIQAQDAPRVFAWLMRGVSDSNPPAAESDIMIRGAGSDWRAVARDHRSSVRNRWQKLAAGLPQICR